jgi:acyl carrier protein
VRKTRLLEGNALNSRSEETAGAEAALNEEELTVLLAEFFAKELGIAEVDGDSHFLFLGADSMNVERLMEEIGRHFSTDLSSDTILEAPTPRALAQLIISKLASSRD